MLFIFLWIFSILSKTIVVISIVVRKNIVEGKNEILLSFDS